MIDGLIDPDRFRQTLTPSELASEGVRVAGCSDVTSSTDATVTFNVSDVDGLPARGIKLVATCARDDVNASVEGLGAMLRSAGLSGMVHVSGGR